MRTLCLCLSVLLVIGGMRSSAEESETGPGVERMRSLAQQTDVWLVPAGGAEVRAKRLSQPVFRYNDQPRTVYDATLWMWTDEDGRPIAVQKIEDSQHRGTGERRWTHCFSSLTPQSVRVEWPDDRAFQTDSSEWSFQAVPDASTPAPSGRARSRQLRALSRQFGATIIIDPRSDERLQLRLLPRPILEFGDEETGRISGAVFGFAAYGTNPDLLLVIESSTDGRGGPVWRYATARMTTGGLILRHDDEVVWTAEWVRPVPAPFDTWTFFFVPQVEE